MSKRYIIPLDLGDTSADKSLLYLRRGLGEIEHSKRVAAYIGGAKKKIVVDTGAPDLERCLKYHPYSRPEPPKPEQGIVAQLAEKAGVKPEEIDIVILTHLHWDHDLISGIYSNVIAMWKSLEQGQNLEAHSNFLQ